MQDEDQAPAIPTSNLKLDITLSQTPRETLASLAGLIGLGYKARIVYFWRGEEQTAQVIRMSPTRVLTHQGTGSEQVLWDYRSLSACRARLLLNESDRLLRHRLSVMQQQAAEGAN